MKEPLTDLDRLWRGACRQMLVLAGLGAVAGGALLGWRWAGGLLAGVGASYLNFSWLHQVVSALDRESRVRRRVIVFLGLRYLLLGGGGYVIVKVLGMNGIAALVGLFVPIGAIFFETLYELVHGT